MTLKKRWLAGGALALMGLGSTAYGSTIIGGNATDFASATNVLDIVFAIDTSGSMNDDIAQIGSQASAAIAALSCPDDVWVRARFFGINGATGSVFNENLRSYLVSQGGTISPNYNSTEDNGWAVNDTALYYPWFTGDDFDTNSTAGKNLYKAVVHIGDEGTENGSPILTDDWDVAVTANQTAIAEGVFVFSWVTDDPTNAFVAPVWEAMATGGDAPAGLTGATGSCGDTGGAFIDGRLGLSDAEVTAAIQNIICTAGGGGTGGGEPGVPVPAPAVLMALGLAGLAARKRFFA